MPPLERCPRCQGQRLAIMYFDGKGKPVGGNLECTECGPRHAATLTPPEPVNQSLLEKKAS